MIFAWLASVYEDNIFVVTNITIANEFDACQVPVPTTLMKNMNRGDANSKANILCHINNTIFSLQHNSLQL